jgi:threonine dehydrogenase-like Zn-dependent dehydrogenase
MGHKRINGGLMPGGRLRMEKLASLVVFKRIDPSKLITHRLVGLESIEKGLLLMKDKPRDLIKPVITITY